jgi:hypothetical protein
MLHLTKFVVLSVLLTSAAASAKESAAKKSARDQTKYCVQVEPSTGSRIITIECWTRAEWAAQGVNIDELMKK